jgi:hypothetical protein
MKNKDLSRREFVKKTAASGLAMSIIPAHVLGGPGRIAPSDKLNVALIGCGHNGLDLLNIFIKRPDLNYISVVDPNKESNDYILWGKSQGEKQGRAGGREVGRRIVNEFYTKTREKGTYKGCTAYADFRDLLEKEKDLDAVQIETPDHLHGTIAIAAMKKNIKVISHKPIANFLYEVRLACETAKKTDILTHLLAWTDYKENYTVEEWIKQGVIGKIREVHRWTNRPVWPQGSPYLPANNPPIPEGFDWDLWLGPSLPRPYSPDYTHTVFRAWYEFGGGALADMGYYGLWIDWRILNLDVSLNASASSSFTCEIRDFRSSKVENKVSFPHASTIHWEVPVKGENRNIDVFWYEGGMMPQAPDSYLKNGNTLPAEGVMFIGEKGIILANYNFSNFKLLEVKNAEQIISSIKVPEVKLLDQINEMSENFRGLRPSSRASFLNAQTIAETICLGNLAIRVGKRLELDKTNLKITNLPEANNYVTREYRKGWEL